MGSFGCGEAGAEVEPGATRFASGFRALQSTGGKDTRQKCGLACANCTPISATPFAPGLRSTTVQGISSPVVTCLTLSFCPSRTGSCNCSSAPCAFTISVLVCSTKSVAIHPFAGNPQWDRQEYPLATALIGDLGRPNIRCAHGLQSLLLWLSACMTGTIRNGGKNKPGELTIHTYRSKRRSEFQVPTPTSQTRGISQKMSRVNTMRPPG